MELVGTDVFGHELLKEEGEKSSTYYIKLRNEDRKRNICTLRDGVVVIPRKRAIHEMRILKAYGLSKLLIEDLPKATIVSVRDENGTYNIPKEDLLKSGVEWASTNPNYEEQLFIKLNTLEKFKE